MKEAGTLTTDNCTLGASVPRVVVPHQSGSGASLEAHPVDRGKESHLGTKAVDLDQDGDLDLVSIGWDEPTRIYVWRNDAIGVALPAL